MENEQLVGFYVRCTHNNTNYCTHTGLQIGKIYKVMHVLGNGRMLVENEDGCSISWCDSDFFEALEQPADIINRINKKWR